MLNSPHQSPPLPPHKDSATYPAQVVDLTLEQQVLLVSLEGDPQLDLQLGPREPAEIKEVKEVKESTVQETAKDNTKPKSRTGSIGSRSKDALSAISKRFSPPPSRSQSQSNSSPSTPAPASTSQYSDTPGSAGSTDDSGSVSHSSQKQTGSLTGSPFRDHSRHHTDSATILPQQHNRRSRSSFTSSCSASTSSSATSTASSPSSSVFFSPTAFYTSLFSPKHSTSSHSHSHSHGHGQCSSINPLSPTSSSNCFSSLTTTTTTTGGTLRSTSSTSGTVMAHRASFAEPGSKSFLAPDNTSMNEVGSPITRQTRSASCTRLFPMSSPSFSSLAMISSLSSGGTPTSETLSIPGTGNYLGSETCPIEEHQAPLLAPGLYPSQAPITAITANSDSPSPSSSSPSSPSLFLSLSSNATKSTTTTSIPPTVATGTTTTTDRRPSPTTSSSSLSFFPASSPSFPSSSALFPPSSTTISSSTTTASTSSSSSSSMLPPLPLFPSLPLGSSFQSSSTTSSSANNQNHPHHPHLPYFDDSRDSSSSSSSSSSSLSLSSHSHSHSHSHSLPPTSTPIHSSSLLSTTSVVSIMGVSSPALHSHSPHVTSLGSHGTAPSTGGAMATCQPHPHAHAHAHAHHPFAHPHGTSGLSFEASVQGLELSLPGKASSALPIANSSRSLMPPASPMSSSFNSDSGFPGGSRRSSKDSV
ncbi:hypothetical protein F5H01DRAFT_365209 [Linnemannia elongata]|nr:hypothetical protein F5H01DRAFT_365209 [Linnemannia elongata]